MAFGDIYYTWLFSGSTTASADTPHALFGTYGGLSDLNNKAVIHVQLQASGADLKLTPTNGAIGQQDGKWFKQNIDVYIDLPPMIMTDASQLHFNNLTAGDNAVARWVAWERVP